MMPRSAKPSLWRTTELSFIFLHSMSLTLRFSVSKRDLYFKPSSTSCPKKAMNEILKLLHTKLTRQSQSSTPTKNCTNHILVMLWLESWSASVSQAFKSLRKNSWLKRQTQQWLRWQQTRMRNMLQFITLGIVNRTIMITTTKQVSSSLKCTRSTRKNSGILDCWLKKWIKGNGIATTVPKKQLKKMDTTITTKKLRRPTSALLKIWFLTTKWSIS